MPNECRGIGVELQFNIQGVPFACPRIDVHTKRRRIAQCFPQMADVCFPVHGVFPFRNIHGFVFVQPFGRAEMAHAKG